MLIRFILLSALVVLSNIVFAEDIVLKLKDGSLIKGELVSFTEGTYTLNSSNLGLVQIASASVSTIESSSVGGHDDKVNQLANDLASINSMVTQDKEAMSMIMSLQNSPDMRAILDDTEVMRAIQAMDFQMLESHPKIIELMRNPKIREIQQRVQ